MNHFATGHHCETSVYLVLHDAAARGVEDEFDCELAAEDLAAVFTMPVAGIRDAIERAN